MKIAEVRETAFAIVGRHQPLQGVHERTQFEK